MGETVKNKFYTIIWYGSTECVFDEHETIEGAVNCILDSSPTKFFVFRGQEMEVTLQIKERKKKEKECLS